MGTTLENHREHNFEWQSMYEMHEGLRVFANHAHEKGFMLLNYILEIAMQEALNQLTALAPTARPPAVSFLYVGTDRRFERLTKLDFAKHKNCYELTSIARKIAATNILEKGHLLEQQELHDVIIVDLDQDAQGAVAFVKLLRADSNISMQPVVLVTTDQNQLGAQTARDLRDNSIIVEKAFFICWCELAFPASHLTAARLLPQAACETGLPDMSRAL